MADDLLLILMDDFTGKLRAGARVSGYALAGGLLAELWIEGSLAFDRGRIQLRSQPPPECATLRRVLGRLMVETAQTSIEFWLETLGLTAVREVSARLAIGGWLIPERRRTILGTAVETYTPRNANAVFWRRGRLAEQLLRRPQWYDLTLLALLEAIGFTETALATNAYVDRGLRDRGLRHLAETDPPTARLTTHVRALAGRAAITHRH